MKLKRAEGILEVYPDPPEAAQQRSVAGVWIMLTIVSIGIVQGRTIYVMSGYIQRLLPLVLPGFA